MNTTDAPELVSTGVAARLLGVSVDTIRRWDAAGVLRCVRTPGGQRRIAMDEIDRIRAGRTSSPQP